MSGAIVHSDRGTQDTSWLFGHRLRQPGLLGSMGKVASAYDNALVESFFGSLQIEFLDWRTWTTWAELAGAIFEGIDAFTTRPGAPLRSATWHQQYESLHATPDGAA